MLYGKGINDDGKIWLNGKNIKSYAVWHGMIKRCYDNSNSEWTVCEEWLYFSNFKKWFDKNYPLELEGAGIKIDFDRNLLKKNNIYSPNTCIFLPKRIRLFISHKNINNTSGYTGVYWNKKNKKWCSRICDFNTHKRINLGYFDDVEDAHKEYSQARRVESEKAKEYLKELGYKKEIIEKIN